MSSIPGPAFNTRAKQAAHKSIEASSGPVIGLAEHSTPDQDHEQRELSSTRAEGIGTKDQSARGVETASNANNAAWNRGSSPAPREILETPYLGTSHSGSNDEDEDDDRTRFRASTGRGQQTTSSSGANATNSRTDPATPRPSQTNAHNAQEQDPAERGRCLRQLNQVLEESLRSLDSHCYNLLLNLAFPNRDLGDAGDIRARQDLWEQGVRLLELTKRKT